MSVLTYQPYPATADISRVDIRYRAGSTRKEPVMKAAVLYELNKPLVVDEIEIDDPPNPALLKAS